MSENSSNAAVDENIVQAMEARIDLLTNRLAALNERVSHLQEEETDKLSLVDDNARLREIIRGLNQTCATLAEEAAMHRSEISGMNADLAKVRNELSSALAQSSRESERLRAANRTLDRFKKSANLAVGKFVSALLVEVGRSGGRKARQLSALAELLKRHGVVDAEWYLKHHVDVAEAGMDPAVHYILHGAEEGRPSTPILS